MKGKPSFAGSWKNTILISIKPFISCKNISHILLKFYPETVNENIFLDHLNRYNLLMEKRREFIRGIDDTRSAQVKHLAATSSSDDGDVPRCTDSGDDFDFVYCCVSG